MEVIVFIILELFFTPADLNISEYQIFPSLVWRISSHDTFCPIVCQPKHLMDCKYTKDTKHLLNCFQDQVKTILDHQVQENCTLEDPTQKSGANEPAKPHYATREEVVMATMKELEKMKATAMETGEKTVK